MRKVSLKTVLGCAMALTLSTGAFAQSKLKIERDNYELKAKQEKNEFKLKEKGTPPAQHYNYEQSTGSRTEWREGQTTTTVKNGQMPQHQATAKHATGKNNVSKRRYAAKKTCTCKTVVAKRKPAAKRSVAYKPKAKRSTALAATRTNTTATPVVVRDTVLITRVDTVFSMMEPQVYTGYRQNTIPIGSDFKQLKIEKENGELQMKVEYEDGGKDKRTLPLNSDLNLYLNADRVQDEYLRPED